MAEIARPSYFFTPIVGRKYFLLTHSPSRCSCVVSLDNSTTILSIFVSDLWCSHFCQLSRRCGRLLLGEISPHNISHRPPTLESGVCREGVMPQRRICVFFCLKGAFFLANACKMRQKHEFNWPRVQQKRK